jgi:hypothetical protein
MDVLHFADRFIALVGLGHWVAMFFAGWFIEDVEIWGWKIGGCEEG